LEVAPPDEGMKAFMACDILPRLHIVSAAFPDMIETWKCCGFAPPPDVVIVGAPSRQ
jgi:hypothetical protein